MNRRKSEASAMPQTAMPAGWLLLSAAVFLVCAAASHSWRELAVLAAALVVAASALRVRFRSLARAIRTGLPLLGIAALFHLAFRFWFITNGEDSTWIAHLSQTAFFLLRLVLFVLTTAILLNCHSPVTYAQVAAHGLGRITGWKIARQVGHIAQLALSMVPQFEQHLAQRKLARRLRGISVSKLIGARMQFVRNELFAAYQFALGYAQSLATVLWSRGYREDIPIILDYPIKGRVIAPVYCGLFCLICLSTLQL